jgi:hypothetical protein
MQLCPLKKNRAQTPRNGSARTLMAQQEGYVQLSEPAEVVERLPAASLVTFEPPANVGGSPPQYPTVPPMQSAPSTSYPNVGPPPPPLMTSTMSVGVPMDLNNDGRADAIGYDTTGDGKVDCITLTLPNPNPKPTQTPTLILTLTLTRWTASSCWAT